MKKLYVLYDANCAFCRRCRQWLTGQPAFLEFCFIPAGSAEADCRFPGLNESGPTGQLTVIDDDGGVYQGPNAFIMCLYALTEFRAWSLQLAQPALLPFARTAFDLITHNRTSFSKWLRRATDEELADALGKIPPPLCGSQTLTCLKTARQNALAHR